MLEDQKKEEKDHQKVISRIGENPSMMIDGSRLCSSSGQQVKRELMQSKDIKEHPVECSKEDQFLFDRFIRCKQEDKPKDTLTWIKCKRIEFLRYVNSKVLLKDDNDELESGVEDNGVHIQMRRLYECTILRQLDQGALLTVRVRGSWPFKCNIIASDQKGRVVKYFPNALLIKKREKIIKLAEEYQKKSLIIIDYTLPSSQPLFFTPFFRKSRPLVYYIMNLPQQNFSLSQPQLLELTTTKNISFTYSDKILKIDSEHFSKESQQRQVTQDIQCVFKMIEEEEKFLFELRGEKEQKDKILELDLLGVSLWRRGQSRVTQVTDKINKLYKMKAQATVQQNEMALEPSSNIHVPMKTKKQQNCAFCLSSNPTVKPKRTCFVCKACSAQKEKPIYLCRKCFGGYHKNPPTHIYKKNQKKTKKLIKRRKRRDALAERAAKSKMQSPQPQENPDEVKKKVTQERFKRLDKLTNEVFQKVETLMEADGEDNSKSCQFFLSMILNNNIRFMQTLSQKRLTTKQQNIPRDKDQSN